MHGRKPDRFSLKPMDQTQLRKLLRDGQISLKVARRAQILLGRTPVEQRIVVLGEKVERNRTTIWRVCERYGQGGLQAALYAAPLCWLHPSSARFRVYTRLSQFCG